MCYQNPETADTTVEKRIEMKDSEIYAPGHKMRELLRDNNLLLMTLSRFDMAFGFGESTVRQVCTANGVDTDTFLAVCNFLSGKDHSAYHVSPRTLMEYLKRAHASFIDFTLPKIRHNIIDAINYSDANDVALLLIKFYDDYVYEAKAHIEYENDVIFKYVENLLDGSADPDFQIDEFSSRHTHMATKLKDLKDVFISHYHQKDNVRLSAVLFDIMVCERDFMSHYEVERHLLTPEIEKLENRILAHGGTTCGDSVDDDDNSGKDETLSPLGEREKDIVRLVAKGYANKEIADRLCLSVHTVTTHRRNISAKLNIHSSAGLTVFAILHHLVDLTDVKPQ